MVTLYEPLNIFFIIPRLFLLRIRNVQTKVVEETKTHVLCSIIFFFENRAVYEIMWKNFVEWGRRQTAV